MMTILLTAFFVLFLTQGCQGQLKQSARLVGRPCEGCEAIFEYGDQKLSSGDTLLDFNDNGIKLKIAGTVYQSDGKSSAAGVILYNYHTNQKGVYPIQGDEMGWAKRMDRSVVGLKSILTEDTRFIL
jgi:protocatechuate 3,4-dioxygenase beta subunit